MENRLRNQNPWWKEANFINADIKICDFEQQPIKLYHPLLHTMDCFNSSITTLRGPRQVGKSTLIKLIIKKVLLEYKVDARQICFYSCEDIDNYHDLIQLLETYFSLKERSGLKNGHSFIFLDEISFVEEWPRGIKSLYERGALRDSFVLLSGSNSRDLRIEAERLLGRRGIIEKPDKLLLPVSFRECIKLLNPKLHEKLPNVTIQEVLTSPAAIKALTPASFLRDDINKLLDQYFITGGYMRPINDLNRNGKISAATYEIYLQWIRGDIAKVKRSETVAMHIFSQVLLKMLSRIEWSSIAKSVDVDSPKTVGDYVKVFEDFFILRVVYQYDIQKRMIRPKKLKKLYFLDPFIFWMVRGWVDKWPDTFTFSCENLQSSVPALVEQCVFNTLNYGLDASRFYERTYFYTEKSGSEIDFVTINDLSKPVALEVKYQNTFDPRDFSTMFRSGVKQGVLVTKDVLQTDIKEGFVAIPFYMWMLLG